MKTTIRILCLAALPLVGAQLGTGCASGPAASVAEPNGPAEAVRIVCPDGVTKAEAIRAAEFVLIRMHFPIEKLDVERGFVRTRALRGAQFLELWRSDNASAHAFAEANLQSIRRSVELQVTSEAVDRPPAAGDACGLPPAASRLCLECQVAVQRLSLPGNEVSGVSAAYGIYAQNTPTVQRLPVDRQQRQGMAWIDLGPDRALAARILERIQQRLQRAG
jgi:hypothetical protein